MSLFPSAFDTGASSGPSKGLGNAFGGSSHKRKRPSTGAQAKPVDEQKIKATQANLEKLMSKIENGGLKEKGEGRERMGVSAGPGPSKKAKKQAQPQQERSQAATPNAKGKGKESFPPKGFKQAQSPASTPKGDKKDRFKKKEGRSASRPETPSSAFKDKPKPGPAQLPLPTFSELADGHAITVGGKDNLTDMQQKMQAKLEGARFRWINEQLYSTPSTEAVAMMKKDPKIFADYHQTHRLLTSGWPQPPLPHIIKTLTPLPAGTVIADLGCGDAGLARALVPQGKIVLSYDLVGDSGVPGSATNAAEEKKQAAGGWVVEADFLEKVPLPGRPGGFDSDVEQVEGAGKKNKKSRPKGNGGRNPRSSEVVDVVVCCLSLMGVNWVGGIAEACRVLKQGGTLQVAEVTSRFISTEAFVEKVESFGFELEDQDSPSTHFTLFKFTKASEVPLGPARGQRGWAERVAEGEQILRGCVYKKR
ncbi:hypothetical protein IAU60_003319 [Kwoniella sp. DSM 27419]